MSDFHYVGEEPLNLKYKDSPQIVRLWRLGIFLKYRPLFGGKETDSDDDMAVPSFAKLPPCFSLEELKHMNQYVELKPAYDFLSSGGMNTRDLTHASCFVSLHPEAPHPILYTTLKLSDERSLKIMFDTCSSLDLIDEDVAKQCNFPLRNSEKIIFLVAGGQRIVSKMLATVTLSLTPSTTTITHFVRTVNHLKIADVILGTSFLFHENATINCAEKRVVFQTMNLCNVMIKRGEQIAYF